MATKNKFSKNSFIKSNYSVNNVQFNNLNLNQNYSDSSKTGFKSLQNDPVSYNKDEVRSICNNKSTTCYIGNKSDVLSCRKSYNSNISGESFKNKTSTGKNDSSINNSSTLSLHITAYENSITAYENSHNGADLDWVPKEQIPGTISKVERKKLSWKRKKQETLNVYFEIPRQQENDKIHDPEVMQFKSHQKLFNPNEPLVEASIDVSDDNMFNFVFNGHKMSDLPVLPLPDKIEVPQKKGVHIFYYSVSNTKIKSSHNDTLGSWSSKSRTKNYIIKNENGKVKAKECQIPNIVTQAQCFYVTHGKFAEKNIKVHKKIYSATSPSSQFPVPNTLIVVVYDIEKDLDSLENTSILSPSSFVSPKTTSIWPKKRSTDELIGPSNKTMRTVSGIKENITTSSKSSVPFLLGFNKDDFFVKRPTTSPTSSNDQPTVCPITAKKLRDSAKKLKEAQEQLQKETEAREETTEKYNKLYDKWYQQTQRYDAMKEKSVENQQLFEEKIANLNQQHEEAKSELFEQYKNAKKEKAYDKERIKELENEVLNLQGQIIEQQSEKTRIFGIKVNNKYTPAAKLTMAELTNMGVAVDTVGPAMGCVAKMFGFTLNAIPSARTVAKSPFLTQSFIKEQLRRVIIDANERSIATTYSSDETKKAGIVWQNEMFTTLDELNKARAYCLGNVPVITKASDVALDAVEKVLHSLNTDDGIDYWETFILNIGNRMSDEASTEKSFTKRVENVKRLILDKLQRFDHLTEKEKDDLAKLRSFYCQLHVLQNLTPVVTNVLLGNEKELRATPNMTEPNVVTLLKILSKHMGNRGASRYTSNTPWNDYCSNNNIEFGRIPDFVGNRFNILFAIAACVFHLRENIIDFIEKFNTDLKQTPVLEWLKDPIVVSHLHILSAYNLYITAPLLRLTEYSSSISTLVNHAASLIQYLEDIKEYPLKFFTGHAPFEEAEEAEEITRRSLAHVAHLDNATVTHPEIITDVVEELAEATLNYFQKKFNDYLPGGVHHSTDADIRTVPRHNKGCEHNFGLLTWDYHHAPHKRSAVRAIRVQAIINKTFNWYDLLSPEEKEKLLSEALINAPKLEKDAAVEQKDYEAARWERFLEKQREEEIAAAIKARKEDEANKVVEKYGGCWATVDQMNAYLNNVQEIPKKRKAVEAQLKCHKLSPSTEKSDAKLCVLSMLNDQRKRVPKPLDILIRNLQVIIVKKNVVEEEDDDEY